MTRPVETSSNEAVISTPGVPSRDAPPGPDSIARIVWKELGPLVWLVSISLGVAVVVRFVLGVPIPLMQMSLPDRVQRAFRYALLLGPLLVAAAIARYRWGLRRTSDQTVPELGAWRRALAAVRTNALTVRVVLAVATGLLLAILLSVVGVWKASIPLLSPWHWDPTLMAADRWLHGGVLPQDWTRQWFGPTATRFLDRMYYLWFRLLALFMVWESFRAPSNERLRALLSLGLAYTLLGNLGAILLSSGGPVYYDRLVGTPSPYAAQTAYLEGIRGLHAKRIQRSIWTWLQTHQYIPFGSISAMPSMHVGVATVMALASWRQNRWLGAAGWLYVLLIFLGSVQLNWHYAVDGYVAVAGTWLIWRASGWLARRWRERLL
jgi:PAP2 superfamily